jgi:hypothetical protein
MKNVDITFLKAGVLLLIIMAISILIPNTLQASAQQQPQQSGFKSFIATGKINTVNYIGPITWIADGLFSMKVIDGDVEELEAAMTFTSSAGEPSHTHEIQNFVNFDEATLTPDNSVALIGDSTVTTNHMGPWSHVDTTISIGKGKAITISLADDETNNHFLTQPIFGLVTLIAPCGGQPGPGMQISPPCE